MEHFSDDIKAMLSGSGVSDNTIAANLIRFARMIDRENSKYNLTGHKTLNDIIQNLITGSLSPVNLSDVPRGTSAADMGTGAGIPGIPLAIKYRDIQFTLFDSNNKKIRFIEQVIQELEIENVKAVCGRVEDLSREAVYRENFGIVFSRAMSDVYMAGELCSPFVKPSGLLYLYVSDKQKQIIDPVAAHLKELSLEIYNTESSASPFKIKITEGLLLEKREPVADIYPRRISAIKRGLSEIEKKYS